MTRRAPYLASLLAALFMLAGCSSQPHYAPVHEPGRPTQGRPGVIEIALQLKGTPYRYGGNRPDMGFDCSGFIQFTHRRAGLRVPRTTRQQFQASQSVAINRIRPGDVLFYDTARDTDGTKPGHVALYLGGGRMIHAPSSGKAVTISRLDNPYWRSRLLAAGRF